MTNTPTPAAAPVPVTIERDSIGALFVENRVLKAELTRASDQLKKMTDHIKKQDAEIAALREVATACEEIEGEAGPD